MAARGKLKATSTEDDDLFKDISTPLRCSPEEETQRLRDKLRYSNFTGVFTYCLSCIFKRLAKEKLDQVRAERNAFQTENDLLRDRLQKIHILSELIQQSKEDKRLGYLSRLPYNSILIFLYFVAFIVSHSATEDKEEERNRREKKDKKRTEAKKGPLSRRMYRIIIIIFRCSLAEECELYDKKRKKKRPTCLF